MLSDDWFVELEHRKWPLERDTLALSLLSSR